MKELVFEIQGSEIDPYTVRIVERDKGNVSAYCSCQAGQNGLHCKHRLGLLSGNPVGLVGNRNIDVETVLSWVRGSDIETIIVQLQESEKQMENLKTQIAKLKRSFAKAMSD